MTYKCKWCQDTGKYYPLHGPAEPCRECAAFVKLGPAAKVAFVRSNDKAALRLAFTPGEFGYIGPVTIEEAKTLSVQVPSIQCTAVTSAGERCPFVAVPNQPDCRFHGGTSSH